MEANMSDEERYYAEMLRRVQNGDEEGSRIRGRFVSGRRVSRPLEGPIARPVITSITSVGVPSPGARYDQLAAIEAAQAAIDDVLYRKAARRRPPYVVSS
jgi:hypothetical protein